MAKEIKRGTTVTLNLGHAQTASFETGILIYIEELNDCGMTYR